MQHNRNPRVAEAVAHFNAQGGTLRTRDAILAGIHPRTLYRMRDEGDLERIDRGVYRLAELPPLGQPDLIPVALRVPEGVICLVSALDLHDLTTEIPHRVHVALRRGARAPRIEHPPLSVYWFSGEAFTEGIETLESDGVQIRVYSAAKTVADCFKYRNKLGLDVALSALKEYLRQTRGHTQELTRHARTCRVENVMRPYVEALL
jgi:predicted transcriptional regulator of viral defense system